MAIKKFSKYIQEGTGTSAASNFVAPKDSDEEVTKYKPRSKGEEDFANMHTVTKHDYPVDVEAQFTGGNTQKPRQPNNGEKNVKQGSTDVNQPKGGGDSRRSADKKQGDMKPVNPVKEEFELDEVDMGQAERGMRRQSKPTGRGYRVVNKAGKTISKHDNQMSAMKVALRNDDYKVERIKEEVELDELKKYDKNADFRLLNRLSQKEKSGKLTSAEKQQMANAKARLRNHGVNEEVELDESDEAKFYIWNKKRQELQKMKKDASAKLQKFPKGNMGLVPDSIRKTPEYKKAKSDYDKIAQAERKHNTGVPKKWLKMASDIRRKGMMKEDLELFEGKVMDALEDIVKSKQAKSVKFANGKSTRIDMNSANAMLNLHKKLTPDRKKKMEDGIEKSPEMFMRLMDVAFGGK